MKTIASGTGAARRRAAFLALAAGLSAGLLNTAATASGIPLEVVRVALPAERLRDGEASTLLPRTPVAARDLIATRTRGRATLQLAGLGIVTLGGDSRLLVHSAEPPQAGRGALLRLQLERGVARLDARARAGMPPQDFRLNLGRLRMRIYGAEVWAELSGSGENVCLLEGAVEIVSDEGSERLDQPGHCLLFGSHNRRLQVRTDTGETLARKLLRTAFAEDYTTRIEAERRPALPPPEPPQPPVAAMVAPAPLASTAPDATAPAGPAWTIVLASLPGEAAARAEAARLAGLGLSAEVRLQATPQGTRYRVTLGRYPEREAAQQQLRTLRAQPEFSAAWLLAL